MQKQKIYTSAEVKEAEERFIIKSYLDFNLDWHLIEYPIQSVQQNQLNSGDSIPDGILRNCLTGQKLWIEVTSVSRFSNDRKKTGLIRKGRLNINNKLQEPINLSLSEICFKAEISKILKQKNAKSYKEFARLADLNSKGVLVIHLDMLDPFHDEIEHLKICECFRDEHILFSLGLGKATFGSIFLFGNVMLGNGSWIPKLSPIADDKMITSLKNRQLLKEELLNKY